MYQSSSLRAFSSQGPLCESRYMNGAEFAPEKHLPQNIIRVRLHTPKRRWIFIHSFATRAAAGNACCPLFVRNRIHPWQASIARSRAERVRKCISHHNTLLHTHIVPQHQEVSRRLGEHFFVCAAWEWFSWFLTPLRLRAGLIPFQLSLCAAGRQLACQMAIASDNGVNSCLSQHTPNFKCSMGTLHTRVVNNSLKSIGKGTFYFWYLHRVGFTQYKV